MSAESVPAGHPAADGRGPDRRGRPDAIPDVTVIVTTYNRPDMLRAALEGFLAQDTGGFELIVADDGSTAETAALVADVARRAPFPVRHVWQEDRGFRAAAARNRAILAARADYLVFTDGDCVPPADFVVAHRALRERGRFVAGNRVLLTRAFSERVLAERLPIHRWSLGRWLRGRGRLNRRLPLLRLPLGPLRRLRGARWKGCKTCNLAVHRADVARIDGFDEAYAGWGMEDSDFVIRLLRTGVRHKSGRFAAPVLHLWHAEYDRSRLPENQAQLRELLGSDRVRARHGLSAHAGDDAAPPDEPPSTRAAPG